MPQPTYLSREGLEKLQAELAELRSAGRHKAAEKIHLSRERGGDVEYEQAKTNLPSPRAVY